jgi:hypothetical protein
MNLQPADHFIHTPGYILISIGTTLINFKVKKAINQPTVQHDRPQEEIP